MTSVRWTLIERLRARSGDVDVNPTYGDITTARRKALTLGKSHANDAFVIAGGNGQRRAVVGYVIKQVRTCNRKLFKGDRSQVDILGHCLWEMTFCGYTPEDIRRTMEEIEQSSKSEERISLAQLEQELDLCHRHVGE